jgi:hypothetical protein
MKRIFSLGLLAGLMIMTASCGGNDLKKVESEMAPAIDKLTALLNTTVDKLNAETNSDKIVAILNGASETANGLIAELKLIDNKYTLSVPENDKLMEMMQTTFDNFTKSGEKMGKTVDGILIKFEKDSAAKEKIHQARMNLAYSLQM